VLRPLVSVRLCGTDLSTPTPALVDSGSEHVLAAPWAVQDAGIDIANPKHEFELSIGGGSPMVRFVDARIRLQCPDGDDDHYIEWDVEVGVIDQWRAPWPVLLGQHGFFDRFTVNMHRSAGLVVVEEWAEFDARFGVQYGEADDHTPRRL